MIGKKFFAATILVLLIVGPVRAESAGETAPAVPTISFPSPGTCPTGLAWDGAALWVADRKTDLLYRLDPSTGSTLGRIEAPGFHPAGLAWDGSRLWCLDQGEKLIYRLDPSTGLVDRTIEVPSPAPRGLAWDGETLWLSDEKKNRLYQMSPVDGTTVTSIPSPSKDPQGLCFDSTHLWVADRIADRIDRVDAVHGIVVTTFDAPGPHARGLAWDGEGLWCVDYQTDRIYRLSVLEAPTYVRLKERGEVLTFTQEFRNYGPGTIATLDLYMAVPHDRSGQVLLGDALLDPPPTNYVTDQWGQKFAQYHYDEIAPPGIVRAAISVQVRLYEVRYFLFPDRIGKRRDVPSEIRKLYLADGDKYRLDHPVIEQAVKEAVGEEKNLYWVARNLYQYLLDNMHYELAGGWNIAPTVLERGSGSCSEYSFVYIALCRAAGLPARYVGSVAVRGDDASTNEVFHRWVEVYLPGYGWVPVDPSRGDKPTPAEQADAFGHIGNGCLVTTEGGGGSDFLEWTYNAAARWTAQGRCKTHEEHIGEWSPLEESTAGAPTSEAGDNVREGSEGRCK